MRKRRSVKTKQWRNVHAHIWVESPFKTASRKGERDGFRIIMKCKVCPMQRPGKWNPVLVSVQ